MQTIHRHKIVTEEVEVPKGHRVCPLCKGKGMSSKYDEGWTSVVYSPDMAALKQCFVCFGNGYIPNGPD